MVRGAQGDEEDGGESAEGEAETDGAGLGLNGFEFESFHQVADHMFDVTCCTEKVLPALIDVGDAVG